jgi:epsilon-lactone hydrolase
MIPKHSVGQANEDCYDGWRWLRNQGYEPDQIVLAGDLAGGSLALALAARLLAEGEEPDAMVAMPPLMQLEVDRKHAHPNIRSDAMFPPKAFDALVKLIAKAARVEEAAHGPRFGQPGSAQNAMCTPFSRSGPGVGDRHRCRR